MADTINVTLSNLMDAADRFKKEAMNIQTAADNSNSAISSLRDMQSNRVTKILEAWDQLLTNLKSNIENVETIANEQIATAKAFEEADT